MFASVPARHGSWQEPVSRRATGSGKMVSMIDHKQDRYRSKLTFGSHLEWQTNPQG